MVTNTNDSGAGSLRQAIIDADDGDTIDFSLTTPATITLTSGYLNISDSITITGPGADQLSISSNFAFRVFYITGADVTLEDLTVTQGSAGSGGGGMYISRGSAIYQSGGTIIPTTPITVSGQVYQRGGTFAASSNDLRIEGSLVMTGTGGLFDAPANFALTGPFTHTAGTYHQIQDVTGSGDVGFPKAGGLIVNANGQGDMGSTEVTIRAGEDCTNVAGEAAQHCYNISPTVTSGVSTTLTFYFWDSEIPAGQTCDAQEIWHWGPGWGSALALDTTYGTGGRDCSAEPYSIRVKDVTDFSPFVVKQTVPNAITMRTAVSRSDTPAYLAAGAAVALGGAAIVLRRRRKA
jgi:LPXTG-motif cell wall-anchored protein